ncbi:serine--tRNA ligase [Christensenellaceae bacterium NSJ-44]|uniref:Serine--tRNA ligase n=1 Tax=Luoshenia tenuis TaxID=2763654 RepID=A0A926HMT7_9FIRM|nr:serine--tRNA ligase [Luoshenia tenuis]MBC8529488.1 serine--tRNA ligase [Luoshenia tenuis]
MLDLNRIRSDAQGVRNALLKRMDEVSFDELLDWDAQRRALIAKNDQLKAQRNKVSSEIPKLKKAGEDVQPIFAQMKQIGGEIDQNDAKLKALDGKIQGFLQGLPNIPDEDVVAGGKENNAVLRQFGEKPAFDFEPKDHVTLCESLGLIDYARGAKLGGNGFWIYTGLGARLEWALLNYFIDEHIKDGYQMMMVPHLLTYACGYTAGQFPKFEEDVFWLEKDGEARQFLLPTAETALVSLHRDEILDEAELPKKYFSYTPCYRREAGSYRSEERGMIRGHQFNKVEMVQFTRPEDSAKAFEELVGKAERLVQGLGLHYQVSKLAAGDVSASMARTYDIEVWIPSMGIYKEVSSASNSNDYQARRGGMRFRRPGGKPEFVHTLNASGLATSRVLPAIVEQCQLADGSVKLPAPLAQRMGMEVLKPVK